MPYNLPKPWEPGYAIPKNIDEEGLERRAFVTKQMPRGTYDDPEVGTAGYAVPRYVIDEGYGQGTFTTKWAPGGTYGGPKIMPWLNQHPAVTKTRRLPGGGRAITMMSGIGDAELPPAFEDYGKKAAQIVLSRVMALPANQRQKALKSAMDKIDSSLWGRSQAIWKRYIAQGMAPGQALPLAISRAMSTGLAAEVINTGLRRSAPQARSLLGLGCYGCMAVLGEDTSSDCTTTPGFSWVYGAGGVAGHWERTKAGATDVPFCKVPPAGAKSVADGSTTVRSHTGGTAEMIAVSLTPDMKKTRPLYFRKDISTDKSRDFSKMPDIMIVPPGVSEAKLDGWRKSTHVMAELPVEWAKFIHDDWTHKGPTKDDLSNVISYGDDPPELAAARRYWNETVLGIPEGTTVYFNKGWLPNAYVKWPNGATMGIYVQFATVAGANWDSANNPLVLKIWASKVPEQDRSFFESIAQGVVEFFAEVVDVVADTVVDVVKDLADLACDALQGPLAGQQGQAAGAAAAGAAGAPPQAGAVGAAIAQKACGENAPPTPVASPGSSILTTLLLAGGAVAAVALLTRKP